MKKILLLAIVAMGLLSAKGQEKSYGEEMQYFDDYLLPHYIKTCHLPAMSDSLQYPLPMGGIGEDYNVLGLAQPFFIDSTISVKGIAAYMLIDQPRARNRNYPLYLDIMDSTLTETMARIRYDTLDHIDFGYDYGGGSFLISYIEVLFDHSIQISDPKFYIVTKFKDCTANPIEAAVGIGMLRISDYYVYPKCFEGVYPVLKWWGRDSLAWLPAIVVDSLQFAHTESAWREAVPYELFLFPILGTIADSTTGISSSINLDAYTYVYPTPAFHQITIASSIPISKVELWNTAGIKELEKTISANSVTLNVSTLPKGSYIAKIYTMQGVVNKKVVLR